MVFFLVSAKSLTGISMMVVATVVISFRRLNAVSLVGGVVLIALMFALFGSSEFGQERLSSVMDTPLLNPDIDQSRSILMSWRDGNSFNWRVAQWTFLLDAWQDRPILGHGIGSSRYITYFNQLAHNDYIRALAEQGIIGLILFLVFLGAQLIRLVQLMANATRDGRQWTLCLVLISVLVAMMLGMITDNILTHTTLLFYWFLLLAIAGWDWREVPTLSK